MGGAWGRAASGEARLSDITEKRETSIKEEIQALKRERIIEAARQLFFERGYQGTTLDAVAERLNVTKPFIYSYFASKADLLGEICQRGSTYSVQSLDEARALDATPAEQLAYLVDRLCRVVLDHQANVAVFFREEKHLPEEASVRIARLREDFDHKLAALLGEGVQRGEFHIADVRLASLAIGGMVSWMFTWYRPHGRLTSSQLAAGMVDLVLRTVGADPERVAPAVRATGR